MKAVRHTPRPINSYQDKTRNSKKQKDLRNKLRSESPYYERMLWKHLKSKQLDGYKFRRQYGVGPFVVDFYCSELSLAIEVDGANHFFDQKSSNYDNRRQKYIESFGINFLRINNDEIRDNLMGVIEMILTAIRAILSKQCSKTTPSPSLERRGTDTQKKGGGTQGNRGENAGNEGIDTKQ